MEPFNLSLGSLLMRFYLMMGLIFIAGFTQNWWLAVFALPIFLSALLGVGVSKKG
ncbi:MAG: hypothetical protein AAGH79_09225 [Bacteroidota bacterium]